MSAGPPLPRLAVQPGDTPWPSSEWPRGRLPADAEQPIRALVERLFIDSASFGDTRALLIVRRGLLVHERYAAGFDATSSLPSWSMAKSITHALAGVLVGRGDLSLDVPVRAPEWQRDGDPRAAITSRQLLAMRTGLAFVEDYVDRGVSDVMEMLWGSGKDDVAAYAASKPLLHAPGEVFDYASGSTNILARHLGRLVGGGAAGMSSFMAEALFAPLGMRSATPKFDAAGTFKGSSFCFCTAEDFARFGLLYLRDGVWAGRRLLPQGWVDGARTLTHRDPNKPHDHYGLHWWINDDGVSFYASGFEGQRLLLAPARDTLIVRLGKTTAAQGPAMHRQLLAIQAALPTV